MSIRDDQRGQAIQVGAVLLFAILVIAFSTYQAVVVPADNRRVEFNHNQEVQTQLAELRNAVLATTRATSARSVTIPLGTRYPSRTLGLNPPPASGSLRTVGTTDPLVNVSIRNATADGETGDIWNGTTVHYNSGSIEYRPNYNRYDNAPTTVYDQSVLYNRFDGETLVLANQTMVSGNRISIVTLNGSLSRTASSPSTVDVRPISSSTETILVEAQGPSSPITLNFTSKLSASEWRRILSDEENVVGVSGEPSPADGEFTEIRVELNSTVEYLLQMTKVGVGQGATGTDSAYLTGVSGAGTSILRGTSQQLTLAVRDRYNNPVAGVTVHGSVGGSNSGSLDSTTKTTGADGRVTFTYETSAETKTGEHSINLTTEDASVLTSGFDASTTANVSTAVTVTAGDGGGGQTSDEQVRYNNDATGTNSGRSMTFSINNDGASNVTITGISMGVDGGSATHVWEGQTGSGAENREVFVDAVTDDGYLETGDSEGSSSAYSLGTDAGLTDEAAVDGNTDATVTVYRFGVFNDNDNFEVRSIGDRTVTVTTTFGDGSTDTYTLNP